MIGFLEPGYNLGETLLAFIVAAMLMAFIVCVLVDVGKWLKKVNAHITSPPSVSQTIDHMYVDHVNVDGKNPPPPTNG